MLGASRISLATARERLSALAVDAAGELDALSADLFAVVALLGRELPLRRALADSSVAAPAKTALIEALLGERVSAPTLAFLVEVANLRWSRPRDLVDAVETLAVLACFELANADGSLDDVEDQLFRFGRIIEREAVLRDLLTDPAGLEENKRALLAGLLSDKVGPLSLRIITAAAVAAPHRRTLSEALDRFARLAADLRQRLNARVTLAVRPDPEQLERLAEALSRVYGKPIGLRVEVDPELLGGLVIRIGDEILDASVTRRLDIARRGLTASFKLTPPRPLTITHVR